MAIDVGHPAQPGHTAYTFAALLAVDPRLSAIAFASSPRRWTPNADPARADRDQRPPRSRDNVDCARRARPRRDLGRIRAAIDRCGPRNHAPGFRATLMRLLCSVPTVIVGDPELGLAGR
jgi:hypothetical protein